MIKAVQIWFGKHAVKFIAIGLALTAICAAAMLFLTSGILFTVLSSVICSGCVIALSGLCMNRSSASHHEEKPMYGLNADIGSPAANTSSESDNSLQNAIVILDRISIQLGQSIARQDNMHTGSHALMGALNKQNTVMQNLVTRLIQLEEKILELITGRVNLAENDAMRGVNTSYGNNSLFSNTNNLV